MEEQINCVILIHSVICVKVSLCCDGMIIWENYMK